MISGSCLCGAIKYEFDETRVVLVNNCYCANCRKSSGAQYATFFQVRPADFRWIDGQEMVCAYESSPGNNRYFCPECGSTAPGLGNIRTMRIPGGALDADPGVRPEVNMYAPSRAAWCATDSARDFEDAGSQEFWAGYIRKLLQL